MFLQSRGCRNKKTPGILLLTPYIFDADHDMDISNGRSVKPIVHLFNGTLI